ncbi:hypothetical protein [Sphingomonas xinjiangensis]|uniref:Apolipoprotein N-acyltransferase n=1 Tax=Sphingomonas xinjiangensis TaxID=643568 RepID=A0A840YI91_9SPHN|nr:hypothetical protein [Sphingomonas xinjiangensis]MBB5711779.1 apolipoprotein N-acyltransferase [Sphingomonas xinjiangensis]
MNKIDQTNELSVEEGLKIIGRTRQAAAARVRAPWWYHASVGLAVAIMAAAFTQQGSIWVMFVGLALIAALASHHRRRTGVSISSTHRGSLRSTLLGFGGVIIAVASIRFGVWLENSGGHEGAMLWIALLCGVFATGLGFVLEWSFIKDAETVR